MSRRVYAFLVTEYLLEVRYIIQFDVVTNLMYVKSVEPSDDIKWFELDSHMTINEINDIYRHTLSLAGDREIINLSQEIISSP